MIVGQILGRITSWERTGYIIGIGWWRKKMIRASAINDLCIWWPWDEAWQQSEKYAVGIHIRFFLLIIIIQPSLRRGFQRKGNAGWGQTWISISGLHTLDKKISNIFRLAIVDTKPCSLSRHKASQILKNKPSSVYQLTVETLATISNSLGRAEGERKQKTVRALKHSKTLET